MPPALGGVSVRVGEVAAPLLYVSPDQVNALIRAYPRCRWTRSFGTHRGRDSRAPGAVRSVTAHGAFERLTQALPQQRRPA
ncbi:MAG: hypothetical protein LAQ69_19120 [Acidobacteriia bacterium]|nr:hypothetical protein [Terriglobia bacterium]